MLSLSNRFAVIGLGNSLRKDDGIGILILEALRRSSTYPQIDYLNFGIASFDLMHRLERYEKILLIDAIDAGLSAGELKIFELKDIVYNCKPAQASTHEFDLKSLFELCKRFEFKSKIYVAGIQVQDVSFGESLSEKLNSRQEEILKEMSAFIDNALLNVSGGSLT